jgi:CDP-glucose 4,6-dehydratase
MRVLVTGHTGFKGAWLTLLLRQLGHEVVGVSLPPLAGSLFERARLEELVNVHRIGDIRDPRTLATVVRDTQPDAVIHLAAQPLVRESYRQPRMTIETNVMGTLNLLEAVQGSESVSATVVATTDKVYRNVGRSQGYAEDEPLGGDDPYSASKAMADLLTQSWVRSFPGAPTAVVRAGNVIGGGDVSPERLLPDLLSAATTGRRVEIRNPSAVRPWQHVLDCLQGYTALMDALIAGSQVGGEWNFGPGEESFVTVGEIVERTSRLTGGLEWSTEPDPRFHEAQILALDASKATRELGWTNRLPFPASLEWTVAWDAEVGGGRDARETTIDQIARFTALTSES